MACFSLREKDDEPIRYTHLAKADINSQKNPLMADLFVSRVGHGKFSHAHIVRLRKVDEPIRCAHKVLAHYNSIS